MDTDELYYCALSKIFAYDCAAARKLIEHAGSAREVFKMKPQDLVRLLPSREPLVRKLFDSETLKQAGREIEYLEKTGSKALVLGQPDYPYRLAECPDAPLVLYSRGSADLNCDRSLAIVGTRHCTFYGRTICRNIVEDLSHNSIKPLIVSGLAYGIDIAAMRAANDFGLETVGVMATGLDEIYPAAHRNFANEILSHGALVTDFTTKTIGSANNFRRRNRIIAGLADAVLLVESREKGGGLITAHFANDYSRDVFAVPGRLTDIASAGCNNLIENDISRLALSAKSIERRLGWEDPEVTERRRLLFRQSDDVCQRAVLKALRGSDPMTVDELQMATDLTFSELTTAILRLEVEGRLTTFNGNRYMLS